MIMKVSVMQRAEGDDKFIARFATHSAGLCMSQMMCMGGFAATDQAGQGRYPLEMILVAMALGFPP
jgi:hypothetical protein